MKSIFYLTIATLVASTGLFMYGALMNEIKVFSYSAYVMIYAALVSGIIAVELDDRRV